MLAESRELTAVERFAKEAAHDTSPAQARYYRDLIPTGLPGVGQQYAFEVDLDVCSGCKACVSACHAMNGLEETETWRSVGQLFGQNGLPIIQHVTTACHHCVDPGCLAGCPTNAYEKDPVTGVVRHLDDQCFGCQYCTMACPYEVPQYSVAKGIVRKCDMCHGRLAAGEAPACVQSCPNQAIRIAVVDLAETVARTDADGFLPDSPPAQLTHPTTVYRSAKPLPASVQAADHDHAAPQHAHLPLVVMLVLTQASFGAVTMGAIGRWSGLGAAAEWCQVVGAVAGLLGLALAPLHLGRPHLAHRAILGWRHSWLSREALVFGLFAPLAIGCAAFALKPLAMQYLPTAISAWLPRLFPEQLRIVAEIGAILAGAAGVYCSARIYQFTGRLFWQGFRTYGKFFGTAAVVGLSMLAAFTGHSVLLLAAVAVMLVKLASEAELLSQGHRATSSLRLTTRLHQRELKAAHFARNLTALLGAALLAISPAIGVLLVLTGELLERFLYFAAVVPLKMPGGIKG